MKPSNGLLATGVAAIALLAVLSGGVVAATQRPTTASPFAAPLPVVPPIVTSLVIDLDKLPVGAGPKVAYRSGRVVKGDGPADASIPGKQAILQAARIEDEVLVMLAVGETGSELASVDYENRFWPERVRDVASLVTSDDGNTLAFATARRNPDHSRARGSAVYWHSGNVRQVLQRPADWGTRVLAVTYNLVYFVSSTDRDGLSSTLNTWNLNSGKATRLTTFRSPAGVDYNGAIGIDQIASGTSCQAVKGLRTGAQLWQTCDYSLTGFTPNGQTVVAGPGEGGSSSYAAALAVKTGDVKRRWTGVRFLATVAENDSHLLMLVDNGFRTPGAIIRCAIGTGTCERATPIVEDPGTLGLFGSWE